MWRLSPYGESETYTHFNELLADVSVSKPRRIGNLSQ